jgi:hypothetical protein
MSYETNELRGAEPSVKVGSYCDDQSIRYLNRIGSSKKKKHYLQTGRMGLGSR